MSLRFLWQEGRGESATRGFDAAGGTRGVLNDLY